MKTIKVLPLLVLMSVFFFNSCSKNENLSEQDQILTVVSDSNSLKYKIAETKKKLISFEKELSASGLELNNNFVIGKIENNTFTFNNNKVERIVQLRWQLRLLKEGYMVSCDKFEFGPKNLNDGYNLLITKSVCSISGESISSARTLIALNGDHNKIVFGGGSVTCKGCNKGCNAKKVDGKWTCTDCEYSSDSTRKCEKSETVDTGYVD